MKYLKNKIYAGLAAKKQTVASLSDEIFSTPRTLFRRMARPESLRLGEVFSIGSALGWTPAELGRVLALEYERETGRNDGSE